MISNQPTPKPRRYEVHNRYLFEGRLVMQTALHIGGGKFTLSHSDSPVVLTPEEQPFIPGSSFKGALRSTIEKLVPSLPESAGLRSCGLPKIADPTNRCPTAKQKKEISEREYADLCHTCLLFGSPFAAARINVNDLYLAKSKKIVDEYEWSGVVEVRDGVAIDRDSETAKTGLKYDFEVVPATTTFVLTMTIENATSEDLQLISIGLNDFMSGFGGVGGKRSRGLGACLLDDLSVSSFDLDRAEEPLRSQQLQAYLLRRTFPVVTPGQSFLDEHIQAIFSKPQPEEQQQQEEQALQEEEPTDVEETSE